MHVRDLEAMLIIDQQVNVALSDMNASSSLICRKLGEPGNDVVGRLVKEQNWFAVFAGLTMASRIV